MRAQKVMLKATIGYLYKDIICILYMLHIYTYIYMYVWLWL